MPDTNNTDTEETPPERNLDEGEIVRLYPNNKTEVKTRFREQIGIVTHGGDVSGRTDTVPIVMTDMSETYRIRARNWEPVDIGAVQEANFLSKPLDEVETQENTRRYNKAVEHVDKSEFDVDLDSTTGDDSK